MAARLGRVFRQEHDERLVARALDSRLVSPDEVAEARRSQSESPTENQSITAVLIARRVLGREELERLEEAEARDEFARAPRAQAPTLPPEVLALAGHPERADRDLGDFVLTTLLGRGGTGEVWRAWDRRLGRWVAIKISTGLESPSAHERFEREALAAGRLAHPNIIPVFQVGTAGGKSFLVMPFIDGRTLEQLVTERDGPGAPPGPLPVESAVRIGHTVAHAVEHAHRQGIVHRDLKPGNIMVDRAGIVFVLDFGLAYLIEQSSSRVTRPGELIGTVSYMAPEQARGDRGAPGSSIDVYGLGAMLYYLVAGRAPFLGQSLAEVVSRVIHDDPLPLRQHRPDLDPRVETIVTKAMDKDPARRYPSAASLAEDLQRVLEDRPIAARPAGPVQRTRHLLRRHPVWSAVGAGVVVALLCLGMAGVLLVRERHESGRTVQQLARLSLETALRLRRAGDTAGMRQVLPQLVPAYQRAIELGTATSETEYLMGRIYRALLVHDRALEHQERALSEDPGYTPALYERAVLLSRQYSRDLDLALAERSAPVDTAEQSRPGLLALRERILADCARLSSLPLALAHASAARGMVAYHRRNLRDARVLLERTVALDPLMEEAWEMLARTEMAAGDGRAAEAAYTRGIQFDRGYAPHLAGRCELERRSGRFDEAIADATSALALDSESTGAWVCRGRILSERGDRSMMPAEDPLRLLDAAERDFDEALRRGELAPALFNRGVTRRHRAILRRRLGQPAPPDLEGAASDFTRAIALEPRSANLWAARGRTHAWSAAVRIDSGQDPVSALDAADADFAEALRLEPKFNPALLWRASNHAYRGLYALEQGQPARRHFEAADADRALTQDKGPDGWWQLDRGVMRTWRGREQAIAKGDPLPDWAAAQEDLDQAARRLPRDADPYAARGMLELERAMFVGRGGVFAADSIAAAQDFERSLAIDPKHGEALLGRARLRRLRQDFASARMDLRQLLTVRPDLAFRVAREMAALPKENAASVALRPASARTETLPDR